MVFRETQRTLDAYEKTETSLFSSFRDLRSRVSNSEFTVSRERVFLRNPARLPSDPEMVLRLLEFVARHGVPLAAETERRLEAARERLRGTGARFRARCGAQLKVILALPHAAMALRVLQNTGLMQVLFPEWESVVSLVVRDFYHRYTVDEHTLVCIERLAALRTTQDPAARRFAGLLTGDRQSRGAAVRAALSRRRQGSVHGPSFGRVSRVGAGGDEAHAGSARRAGYRRRSWCCIIWRYPK